MKYLRLLIITCVVCLSCDSDNIETTTYLLTEEEKDLLPFESNSTLTLKNQNEEVRQVDRMVEAPKVYYSEFEDQTRIGLELGSNTYKIADLFDLYVVLYKSNFNKTQFSVYSRQESTNAISPLFGMLPCSEIQGDLSSQTSNITIGDISFENVIELNNCFNDDDSQIERLIYSTEKGIEYIALKDGSYWLQVDQ